MFLTGNATGGKVYVYGDEGGIYIHGRFYAGRSKMVKWASALPP